MWPMRTSTIFRNRWWAVVWAAGIIWFAYDVAASAPSDDNSTANSEQTNEALNGS